MGGTLHLFISGLTVFNGVQIYRLKKSIRLLGADLVLMMPEVDHDSSGLLSIELVVIILTSLNKCAD